MTSNSELNQVSPALDPVEDLRNYLQNLVHGPPVDKDTEWRLAIHMKLETVLQIRHILFRSPHPSHIKDTFRQHDGFQTLIVLLGSLQAREEFISWTDEDSEILARLIQAILGLLATALQDHWGNSKYFRKRVWEGGWIALERIMLGVLIQKDAQNKRKIVFSSEDEEQIFGCLMACATNVEAIGGFFSRMKKSLPQEHSYTKGPLQQNRNDNPVNEWDHAVTQEAHNVLGQALGPVSSIENPEWISLIFKLWLDLETSNLVSGVRSGLVSPAIPAVLNQLVSGSSHNLVAVHGTKLLSALLPCLLNVSLSTSQSQEIRALIIALLQYGVTDLNDAYFLYRHAHSSVLVADLLHQAFKGSHMPPHLNFDLSMHGFASVELPNIGCPFPPDSASAGYTLSVWVYVMAFDPDAHTTIFGAFDSTQTCFVLVYLEKDTRNLILQTSVTSSRPSVRFKSVKFEDKRWYHVCLVHKRPRTVSSSKASLFVDGEFVEQLKAHYPAAPPADTANPDNQDPRSSSYRSHAVQAFFGTPQDLAARVGRGLVSSRWRLASAHLFADALSDDLIAVYKQLGPRYSGNYQDCLGSFQTYRASTALNLRNESLHPGREEKSEIITAIRSKASVLMPESRIILNISPTVILDDDDRNNIDETQLTKSLSKAATRNLRNVTRGGRNAIAINGAVPSLNEALLRPFGFGILTGSPAVTVPQTLDNAAWRVGGCAPVGLSLVSSAHSHDEIVRAVDILFESIKESWRNSEAMERENGFGVLAALLQERLAPSRPVPLSQSEDAASESPKRAPERLTIDVLLLILKFIGYDAESPEDSVVNNPLAYRVLLVDLDLWRNASSKVQELYYQQFVTFSVGSKAHIFNSKRLSRMRIVKKWLDALKGDVFTVETFDYFLSAFKSLIIHNLSADTLRSLALYITYAIHKPVKRALDQTRLQDSMKTSRQSHANSLPRLAVNTLSLNAAVALGHERSELLRCEVGFRILELYADILCNDESTTNLKKFARTVTNKWLLYLMADDEPAVVILAAKILGRLLVLNGSGYVKKFAEKTGGFLIMRHRMKRWWNVPTIWPICFAILLGKDIASIDFEKSFDLFSLVEMFAPDGKVRIVCVEILPVITAMLQNGLKAITKEQENPESPLDGKGNGNSSTRGEKQQRPQHLRQRSMNLSNGLSSIRKQQPSAQRLQDGAATLHTVARLLNDLHTKSQFFRDFAVSSNYVQELLFVLFPIIVSSDIVSAETELNARDSTLTFDGSDVMIRPLSRNSGHGMPIVRTTVVEPPSSPQTARRQPFRRASSYVLVTSNEAQHKPSPARLNPLMSPTNKTGIALNVSNSVVEELLEIIVAVYTDQLFARKDFPGLGLFMKVPPGFQEHQAYFESFVLRNTLSHLGNTIQLDTKLLLEPRVLTNLARFATHLGESIFEGWFIGGTEHVLEFLGNILEHLQRPDIASLKSVRLCNQNIASIRTVLLRVILLRLSELEDSGSDQEAVPFLDKLIYWQTVLFAADQEQEEFLKLLGYLLYSRLISVHAQTRASAANLWRILLVQKPNETTGLLSQALTTYHVRLAYEFKKLTELDNESFLTWVDDRREDLDALFFGTLSKTWEDFVAHENRKTEETVKSRISKRREKLKAWASDTFVNDDVIRRHEVSSDHWRANIYTSEHVKRQRTLQDQQDNINFNTSAWAKMKRELHRPCGLLDDSKSIKWRLDQTEGKNRMRLRLIRDINGHLHDYMPKRKQSQINGKQRLSLDVRRRTLSRAKDPSLGMSDSRSERHNAQVTDSSGPGNLFSEFKEQDDDFEMVDDPREELEDYEDKNRKVMRSLQRGDQVEYVNNVSRIVGLEASEGLLILGKDYLYLLDNFFQRSDGEIVNVWQAPQEERDPYLQMISGREEGSGGIPPTNRDHETRSWHWEDILSISKRRFLLREVAIEIFFFDGRSYLLTTSTPQLRDELSHRLLSKASSTAGGNSSMSSEDSWRFDSLRSPEENTQTLGSKFTNVFVQGVSNPATRKWIKGEMSNFHYLMLVNTMAGRTFNDLTQYPVFPWVLADYTSEELDLSNPRSFRDLAKPMGCQTPERQAEFRDRYQTFAEMGDHNSPSFHYGTHYSSAMIVTSYLIRLQPFVQSYLLLQGGAFDHPDRLFYSIENAWTSASRDNMTDVRELIPEFYFLPEFLTNANGYDFGLRQGTGGSIDNVSLPPWAKGDPKIFIAKHREALESEYVGKHLHQWIDLVFGQKQRGEAALDATNVFHHLSYHGAKNLDTIDDPVERLATIGIIHNFGQTPHQVFQRIHPAKEVFKQKSRRLDIAAERLTRLPFPLLESENRVSSLIYSAKQDRLLCSGAFRLYMPPNQDRYLEWGFTDGSVRFFATEGKKLLGLFEHLHQGQLSCARFVDSRTLITAGTDCTVSVWTVISTSKFVDLQPKVCLFGHRTAVTILAVARSFSALLSASSDGQVLLWDLNRLEFVRHLAIGKSLECACINDVTGIIMLCHGLYVTLLTLNGDLLLEQNVCTEGEDCLTSSAFYEGNGAEWLERDLVFTGHKHGVVNVWEKAIRDGRFVLNHVKRMDHLDPTGSNVDAAMTFILPMPHAVYTGDDNGIVYEWDCIQRHD